MIAKFERDVDGPFFRDSDDVIIPFLCDNADEDNEDVNFGCNLFLNPR